MSLWVYEITKVSLEATRKILSYNRKGTVTKINQAKEKRLRNEVYAKKYEDDDKNKKKVKLGTGRNWCRIRETNGTLHPITCSCNLPEVGELIAMQRSQRRPRPTAPVVEEHPGKRRFR